MKAPKEIRKFVNRQRAARSRKNGVVKHLWESPEIERKFAMNKRQRASEGIGGA